MRKFKPHDAQTMLIDAIWKLKGGMLSVARILDENPQSPVNWRFRGGVPLSLCPMVAKKLGISIWGLNYKDLKTFYGADKSPSWDKVVRSYDLEHDTIVKIMSFSPPT